MTRLAYGIVIVACYGLVFMMLAEKYRNVRIGVLRVFWGSAVGGALLFGVLSFMPAFSAAGSYDPESGLPLDFTTVLKISVIGPVVVLFSILLLMRFRELVLFKRTRKSVRQWYLMLAVFCISSGSMLLADPNAPINVFAGILLGVSVILMVANSFRLSRIVYLSFREKLLTVGFSVMLVIVLAYGLLSKSSGLYPGESHPFLRQYNFALSLFALQAVVFGIMYSTTASLSLLFHLPTTGEFQQKAGELAVMHSVARLTGEVLDMEKLVTTIVASPIEAGIGNSSWLALTDVKTGSLRPRVVATRSLTPKQVEELFDTNAIYEEAVQAGEPLLMNQASADHRVRARPGDGVDSLLVVPLTARNDTLGALFVAKEVAHGFETDDVETISTFAGQAALALDNARLFADRLERERLTRELVIAREVQQKLLPQKIPTIVGAEVAASSVSAYEVGGDYYDLVQVGPHRWAFIVGDVSGKGTSAAFYMAELKGVFRVLSRLADSPTKFLAYANSALANSMERNVFISAVYGILDLEGERFTLARAGHCPVATVAAEGEVEYLRTDGLGLGLDSGPIFDRVLREERRSLRPGDVFVLYTDGVVESRNSEGEEYGYGRLKGALREHRSKTAGAIHSAILDDLNVYTGRSDYDDDMTLVVVKWNGTSAGAVSAEGGHSASSPIA
jgi:serine phosphatase RsbU (regulator of sigma subunit)